ncbi:hypothetical protein LD85_1186 [Saccharolobus islandicus L.D.8.5]|uniref:Uncharacterized protein n=1 Tax=Saccharolobus islandicus (strain L.D.8.5 / Lassen \|nr:hypothetical protein LD85_1186 [Sulfolobus islandicus L.D.8.5]
MYLVKIVTYESKNVNFKKLFLYILKTEYLSRNILLYSLFPKFYPKT